ncbi:serine/threonine-protein kinase [Nocardiopsis coralliicola]
MGAGQRVGGFRLVRELGSGGFGTVYLGEDTANRQAAVKLLHPHLAKDAQVRRYFAQELANMRQVQGFCLAEVLDADDAADQPWIATEYVQGPTLEEAVREHGPRTGGDLQRLAMQSITALSAIHAAGVVHRDLKPANILLGPDGARVIDFGIARALDADTSSATRIGTLGYMAPEQLEGTALGPAADVFAWASVIIHAATGADAFPGATQASRIRRVLTSPPETGSLADPLLSIVLACAAKEPGARPTARRVLDMLLTGSAAPPPAGSGDPTAQHTAPDGGGAEPVIDPGSWKSAATDRTPFTPDALLPRGFTDKNGMEFARMAAGEQPCSLAAAGGGAASAGELVQALTSRGCTRLLAGVYEEQPGDARTEADSRIVVSVSLFPFPDKEKALDFVRLVESLPQGAWLTITRWCRQERWLPATWRRQAGSRIMPLVTHRSYHVHYAYVHRYRYVATAVAYRADLGDGGDTGSRVRSAASEAAESSGPENHWL